MMLRIKPERLEEYGRLHAAVWPGVLERIFASAVKNYSVYYRDGWVFSYLEYWGDDFEADMRLMAVDLEMRRWWALTEPMQEPIPSRAPGEWWARMEEIFHHD
jgi:L-rhamnose mutarotase